MKYGPGMTKNDIDSTLNVTSIIVMYTFVIKKSVMSAIKSTTIKCNFVTTNICSYRLVMWSISNSSWCIILSKTYGLEGCIFSILSGARYAKEDASSSADQAFKVNLKRTRLNWLCVNPLEPWNDHLYLYLLILVTWAKVSFWTIFSLPTVKFRVDKDICSCSSSQPSKLATLWKVVINIMLWFILRKEINLNIKSKEKKRLSIQELQQSRSQSENKLKKMAPANLNSVNTYT